MSKSRDIKGRITLNVFEIAGSDLSEQTKHEFIEWLISVELLPKEYWVRLAEIIHKEKPGN